MNNEQKKKLKEDAIRDSGIVDRVSEFRNWANRFYQLSSDKGFKSVLTKEVHQLEGKLNPLLVNVGASYTPSESGTENTNLNLKSDSILKKIRNKRPAVAIDIKSRKKQLDTALGLLNDIRDQNNKLSTEDVETRRQQWKEKGINMHFESLKQLISRLGDETNAINALQEILADLEDYYKNVLKLAEGEFKWWRRSAKLRENLEEKYNELKSIIGSLPSMGSEKTHLSNKKGVILGQLEELEREFGNRDQSINLIAKITGLLGNARDSNSLIGLKTEELNMLSNANKTLNDLISTIEKLNKRIKDSALAA